MTNSNPNLLQLYLNLKLTCSYVLTSYNVLEYKIRSLVRNNDYEFLALYDCT